MGKHMKRLRAEKSKVQLKKKVLPKGQNITNTTFTVKKILTPEQLKKVSEDEPVSNWNVPLKDLLIRLSHYNYSSRLNGLSGIKEIVTKYPEVLYGPSLKPLISRLLELLTDEEHKIRVKAIELLSYLFDLIPSVSLIPFKDLLNVYLGCAMTHRNASVQRDSMRFIDVLIKYFPEAIKSNFKSLIQNLTRVIKSNFYDSPTGVFSSKGTQGNLEKSKTEMLHRLYQFLCAGYSNELKEHSSDCKEINVSNLTECKLYLRNTCDLYKKIPDFSNIFKSLENKGKSLNQFDFSDYQNLCSLILPLLFDTWAEFSPTGATTECALTSGTAELMAVILKILLHLYEKAIESKDKQWEHWLVSNYSSSFQKYFTTKFPYLPLFSNISSQFSLEDSTGYVMQNLIVCYLSYSFKIVPKNSSLKIKMENYLSDVLQKKSFREIDIFSKTTELVIKASKHETSNVILDKMVEAYMTTSNSELRKCLSKTLAMFTLEKNEINNQKDIIRNWMKALPQQLCESQIFLQEIENMMILINKPIGVELLKAVEEKAQEIIKNLANIKIEGTNQLEGQKMIACILYRCNNAVLEEIIEKRLLDSEVYPENLKNFISDIFSHKLMKQVTIS